MARVYRDCRVLKCEPAPTGLRFTVQAEAPLLLQLKEALRCQPL